LLRRLGAAALAAAFLGPFAGHVSPAAAAESHPIVFPVDGPVHYSDDFGAARVGHTHQGNDLMGYKLEHEVAASDGVISWVQDGTSGTGGNMLKLTGDDGWWYYYIHVNNDTPGTDDGANPAAWRFAPGIKQGSRVLAGQFISFMGDSGDAETTAPHLHFEVHRPDGTAIDPFSSLQAAPHLPELVGKAVAVNPTLGYYILTGDGHVHPKGGAPDYGSPTFPGNLARSMAVMPDGKGYVVLDALGGVHRYGSAVAAFDGLAAPYFGFAIARSVAINPAGTAFAVLDGWGGVHQSGETTAPLTTAYWAGWDIARSLAYTASGDGLYVLDGWGGVHTSGDAHPAVPSASYWVDWDIARTIVAAPLGAGYTVVDGFGGTHAVGTAVMAPALWVGVDRWVAAASSGKRWVAVDAFGGSTGS
jgi:hypothetical protein